MANPELANDLADTVGLALRVIVTNPRDGPPTAEELQRLRDHVVALRLRGRLSQELCQSLLTRADEREACLQASQNPVTRQVHTHPRSGPHPMKLPARQSAHVTVNFVNANGNPADVDGPVVWMSSDTNIATVSADTDKSEGATITAGSTAGSTIVSATADADLGEGVAQVVAELEVLVVARGVAIGGEIVPDMASHVPGIPGAGIDNSLPDVGATPR